MQAPLPPSLELPHPPADLRAVRKGDRVYLFWAVPTRTMDRQSVRRPGPTRICRSLEPSMTACGAAVGNVAAPGHTDGGETSAPLSKPEQSFVDVLPRELQEQNPTRLATYAVEALNLHARSAGLSNQVQVALAPTLPPPENFRAELTSEGVVLAWDWRESPAPSPDINYRCRIYRKSVDKGTDAKIADLECSLNRFEDKNIEWQKGYEYRIAVVTSAKLAKDAMPCPKRQAEEGVTAIPECSNVTDVEGDDSPPQRVFTKDIYPPAVPSSLQAVFSGAGQPLFVDLLWAPDTDADLAGYNVYRREEGGQPVRINPSLVKTPAFRDSNAAAGKTYFYSVSAVDGRGNESGRSEEASETVPPEP